MIKNCNSAFSVQNVEYLIIPNEGNRTKIAKHVANIKKAILAGYPIPPILVDKNTRQIIDGQHRYWAYQELWQEGNDVWMDVVENNYLNPILAAIRYNNTAVTWVPETYVKAYIADGRESYRIFYDFVMSHPLLANSGRPQWKAACKLFGYKSTDPLKKGIIQINDLSEAERIYRELEKLEPFDLMSNDHIQAWIDSRQQILTLCDFDSFIRLMERKFIRPNDDVLGNWKLALAKVLS